MGFVHPVYRDDIKLSSALEESISKLLRGFRNDPAVLDAFLQWADNPSKWREGMNVEESYPFILENLIARYPEPVARRAFEYLQKETAKLLVMVNFNVERVRDSLKIMSTDAVSVLLTGLVTRTKALAPQEQIAIKAFAMGIRSNECVFSSVVGDNPKNGEDFRRHFACILSAVPSITESRLLAMLGQTGITNRLLRIAKMNRFVEYIPSSVIRISGDQFLEKLTSPSLPDTETITQSITDGGTTGINLLRDILSSNGVIYSPKTEIPSSLASMVTSYNGYIALSPFLNSAVKSHLADPDESQVIAQTVEKEFVTLEVVANTVSGDPISGVRLSVGGVEELTNTSGTASLRVPPGHSTLYAHAPGYESRTISVEPQQDHRIQLLLEETVSEGATISLGVRIEESLLLKSGKDATGEKEIHIQVEDLLKLTVVSGDHHTGKSKTVKRAISRGLSRLPGVIILDWRGSYEDIAKKYAFTMFSLKPREKEHVLAMNPFEISLFTSKKLQAEDSQLTHARYLSSLIAEHLIREKRQMSDEQHEILDKALLEMISRSTQSFDLLINSIHSIGTDAARALGTWMKKSSGLQRVIAPASSLRFPELTEGNIHINLSGKGLQNQPRDSEKILFTFLILKILESHASKDIRRLIVLENFLEGLKYDSLLTTAQSLFDELTKSFGLLVTSIEPAAELMNRTRLAILHRQSSYHGIMGVEGHPIQEETARLVSELSTGFALLQTQTSSTFVKVA